MADKDAEFQKRLLATFKVEAEEHLKGISAGLLELEKAEDEARQAELVEAAFREAHSLKGAARAVNLGEIESFCQAFESVFAALKGQKLKPSATLFDLLQQALDVLGRLLATSGSEWSAEEKTQQRECARQLEKMVGGQGSGSGNPWPEAGEEAFMTGEEGKTGEKPQPIPEPRNQPPAPPPSIPDLEHRSPTPAMSDTVRVSTAKLSAVLLQSEEMLAVKLSTGQRAAQMREAAAAFHAWKKEWSRALPAVQKAKSGTAKSADGDRETEGALSRVFEFLEWNSTFIQALAVKHAREAKAAERDSWAVGGMVNSLLEETKKVLMFPFSSLLEVFPKIVRDLSRDGGKEVELVIRGGEIDIDRRILEEMKDPFVHLVRNAIDHGVEKPGEREAKGKPRQGRLTISVAPKDGKVEVVVADDGAGIGIGRLRAAVLKLGLLPAEKTEELADAELLPLIFQSGVSTSPIITEISGRGLGLAIVKEKVEKLGGSVSLETQPDAGATFRILLPLTVATFRGILVRTGEQLFVLPTTHVERALRVNREEILTVENRETIHMDGRAVALARLGAVLELGAAAQTREADGQLPAVVVTAAGQSIAFAVDEVLNEQEVLLKNLGPQLSRVRNVAGATVLGSGRVVPILNVPDLMKSAVKAGASRPEPAAEARGAEEARQSVLVVEDSITSRTLLRNILESAGYEVATAVDGIDGFTQLRTRAFDMVVSDVDMPRMNGFDLTARIRADRQLTELPVVLVTALASREDRERGVDAGANAYIVKSSFDQGNLLEVIKRLI